MPQLDELFQIDDGKKKIVTENHTLFISEDNVEMKIDLGEEYNEVIGTSSVTVQGPSYNLYELYIGHIDSDVNEIAPLLNELRQADEKDELIVYISSPGGSLYEGFRFINIFEIAFNGRTTTVLDVAGASMAAMMFCAGDVRIMPENGYLMFHNWSGGIVGKAKDIKANFQFFDKRLEEMAYKTLSEFFSDDEIEDIRTVDYYLDAEEAALRGLATHVIVNGVYVPAEEYLEGR